MALVARGVSGEVRKGYQTAVRFGAWTLSEDILTAPVLERVDVYCAMGGPFAVRVDVGGGCWQWRDVPDLPDGDTLYLRVDGPPEFR